MAAELPRAPARGRLRSFFALYRTFGPHVVRYWPAFLLGYASLMGTVAMKWLTPWPLKLIFDSVLLGRPVPEGLAPLTGVIGREPLGLLTVLCVAMVLVALLQGLFGYAHRYLTSSASHRMLNDIRRRVFDHLQTLPLSFHASSRSGDVALRLTSDVNALRTLLVGAVQDIVRYALTVSALVATMLWMDWRLTLIALAVVPPLYVVTIRFSGRVQVLAREKRTKESEVASLVYETVTSMATVQAFNQETQEMRRFAKESQASLAADLKKTRLARAFGRAVDVMIAVGTALVVWFGARHVLTGAATPGDLIVFTAYLRDLYAPVGGLSALIMEFTTALVSGQRIAELLHAGSSVKDAPGARLAPPFRGDVSFDGVTFGYAREEGPVLQDVAFSVKAGQMVALVGPSGTGKSTVVNLLLRFFDPWAGRVLIDGHDIRQFTLQSLRHQMSVVLQDPVLFRRTVRENIAYGRPDAPLEDIVTAATAAQADEFITRLPRGYETVLDERGDNLSGGQRQRIALARAFLRGAPILVFDEPTTALDAITEAELGRALARVVDGRTTFVIAHRLSTIEKADLILVLQDGRVVAQGTHPELLANSDVYRRLASLAVPVSQNAPEGN
jgi:ABC-type multidrug transport system fused ATPase/permease subunit